MKKNEMNLSNAEKVSRRDAAIDRIVELLGEKKHTVVELAAELHIPWNTVYGYLRFMQEVGDAHQTGEFRNGRRELWAAGRAVGRVPHSVDDNPQRAWIVPARQMGMPRHWMDVAFFGPAQEGAAA